MIVEPLYCVRCNKLDPNWGTKKCKHCGKNTQYTNSERNEIIEREYKNIMDDFHKKYPKIPYRTSYSSFCIENFNSTLTIKPIMIKTIPM